MDPVNRPNAPDGGQQPPAVNVVAADVANNNNRHNRPVRAGNQLINIRDRLFHALFYRVALTYATLIPRPVRRFIEMALLLKVWIKFVLNFSRDLHVYCTKSSDETI